MMVRTRQTLRCLGACMIVAAWVLPVAHSAEQAPSGPTRPAAPITQPAPERPAVRERPTSDRCYTPAANCLLSDPLSKGVACWCVTPFGASHGQVR